MNERPVRKYEFALCALYCLVTASFSKVYWGTKADTARLHHIVHLIWFFALLAAALFPRLSDSFLKLPRALRFILIAPFAGLLIFFSIYAHIIGIGILFLSFFRAGATLVILEFVAFFYLWRCSRLKKLSPPFVRMSFISILFFNSVIVAPLFYFLWRPPSLKECEKSIIPGVVARLTSQDFTSAFSAPYDVQFLPEKNLVAASFKMNGNLSLDLWNNEKANQFVVIDVSGDENKAPSVLPMSGFQMPEWVAWNPLDETLYVTLVGADRDGVAAIDLSEFPKIKLKKKIDLPFEPNSIAMSPDNMSFTVFGIEGKMTIFNASNFSQISIPGYKEKLPGVLQILDSLRPSGSRDIYLSTVGNKIMKINPDNGKTAYARVRFGAGMNLASSPEDGKLYQSDALSGAINVVDSKTMSLIKRVSLDYKPRPLEVDSKRDLLMVGDWFGGAVHFYRLSTLEQIGNPVPVSRYLRSLTYDKDKGMLYTACLCGVYQIDVPAFLAGSAMSKVLTK